MSWRALLALATVLLVGCGGQQDTLVLRVGHALDQSHSVHKAMEEMDRRLAEYSGGTMRVKIYPNSQLGSERELIELLQIGSLAMTKVSAAPLESFVAEIGVFNIPFLFEDSDHYQRVIDSAIGDELLASLARSELVGLGYYDAGPRSFYTIDRPVNTPQDLKGIKIRVMNSPTAVAMVQALGAAATPISLGELYTALQQGVIDGAENNLPSFYLLRHFEVARHLSIDEHTFIPDVLLLSRHIWNNMTPQQQTWVQAAADDSVRFQRSLWQQDSAAALAAVQADGVAVAYPDKAAFMESVQHMHQREDAQEISRLIDAIKQLGNSQ